MENSNLKEYMKENLRLSQLKQVEMLRRFDSICKKHNLTYWLDGGTLLGAVRHKGFIPWDDDLDIAMPTADLKKFMKVAAEELPEDIFLQNKKTDPEYPFDFVKLRDMNSFYVEFSEDFKRPYQKGVYVDIFEFIPYPSLPRKWVKFFTKKLSRIIGILRTKKYFSLRTLLEWFYFSLLYCLLRPVWSILFTLFRGKKYVSNVLSNNGYGIMHRVDAIYPLKPIQFEGYEFNGPADPDAYLKDLYQDYMQLPPQEKRVYHAIYINPYLKKQ